MSNNLILFVLALSFFCSLQAQGQDLVASAQPENTPSEVAPLLAIETTPAPAPNALAAAGFDLAKGQSAASFAGFDAYAKAHLHYPERARRQGVEGTVELLVTVAATGEITDAVVVSSLSRDCDRAATDLLLDMPHWEPASNFGIPVRGKKIVQVNFRLQ